MITVTPKAIDVIQSFLAEKGVSKPIRVHLRSTGCCDASLGLMADSPRAEDLTYDIQGITFVISTELGQLTGDITIDYVAEKERTGFVLTSARSISEWDGFGTCTITA
jgi:Fe-S cluster assembly iron-binding protein IscA